MLPEALIDRTLSRFPTYPRGAIRIDPLEKGGSDRKYYRIRVTGEQSLILVRYGDGREENRLYCDIAAFLAGIGLRVPEIYYHDDQERLIWMEDLGETDLWSCRHLPWDQLFPLYQSALHQMAALHTRAAAALPASPLRLQTEFNADLYSWEQHYFFENCAARLFNRADPPASDTPQLLRIARHLASLPRVLVHRDFQSQNVLIHRASAWLIDFQGLRPGLPHYDLASLVYDPYVPLTPARRQALIQAYISALLDAGGRIEPDFHHTLDLCAMQRLMQALGAYGYLGRVKDRPAFLDHVPAALASLRDVLARIPNLAATSTFIHQLA